MNDTEEKASAAVGPAIELGPAGAWLGPKLYLVALAVFVAAVLFEARAASAFGVRSLLGDLEHQSESTSTTRLATSFLAWRSAMLLLIGVALGSAGLAARQILLGARRHRRAAFVLVASALALGLFTASMFGTMTEPSSFLKALTMLVAESRPGLRENGLVGLMVLPKRCAELLAAVVGVGMAAIMILPARLDLPTLRAAIRALRLMLYSATLMLVIGVFATRASYTLVLDFGRFMAPGEAAELAESGASLAAAFYTLVLAAGYLPATLVLSGYARRFAAAAVARGEATSEASFLAEREIEFAWKGQLGRILAVSAPFLTSIVPGLGHLFGG
ncbi:MAG: hypothetical protein H6807_04105 [Planctomycetes bacterium]|nr:hypothetical protein [Planctomycetota bacterium]